MYASLYLTIGNIKMWISNKIELLQFLSFLKKKKKKPICQLISETCSGKFDLSIINPSSIPREKVIAVRELGTVLVQDFARN